MRKFKNKLSTLYRFIKEKLSLDNFLFKVTRLILITIIFSTIIVIVNSGFKLYQVYFHVPQKKIDVSTVTLKSYQAHLLQIEQENQFSKKPKLDKGVIKEETSEEKPSNDVFTLLLNQSALNLTEYTIKSDQNSVHIKRFKRVIISHVAHYSSDLRLSFIRSLTEQTEQLISSQQPKKLNVDQFLEWFIYQFKAKVQSDQSEIDEEEYLISLEKQSIKLYLSIVGGAILAFIISTILIVLIKIEVNTRPIQAHEKLLQDPQNHPILEPIKVHSSEFLISLNRYSTLKKEAIVNLSKLCLKSEVSIDNNSLSKYLEKEIIEYSDQDKYYFMKQLATQSFQALESNKHGDWKAFLSHFLDKFHTNFQKVAVNSVDEN